MKQKLFVEGMRTNDIGFKGVGCPHGTVPIRRVNEDDLIETLSNIHPSNLDDEPGHHVSIYFQTYIYWGQSQMIESMLL